jgi:23S rRNA pseudouridine1911/1915/1917 synthase
VSKGLAKAPAASVTAACSSQDLSGGLADVLIARQALHALRLEFRHPDSGQPMQFEAPLAPDIAAALDALRAMASSEASRS